MEWLASQFCVCAVFWLMKLFAENYRRLNGGWVNYVGVCRLMTCKCEEKGVQSCAQNFATPVLAVFAIEKPFDPYSYIQKATNPYTNTQARTHTHIACPFYAYFNIHITEHTSI